MRTRIILLFFLFALIRGKGDKLLVLLSLASGHSNRRQLIEKMRPPGDTMIYGDGRCERMMELICGVGGRGRKE